MTQWIDRDDLSDEERVRSDIARRASYRRRQRLTLALSALAMAGLLVGLAVVVRPGNSSPASADATIPVATVPVSGVANLTAGPSPSASATAAVTVRPSTIGLPGRTTPGRTTPGRTTPGPTTPTAGLPPKAPPANTPGPRPSYPSGTDLQASGPGTVTLRPADGRYRGQLSVTVRNVASTPYVQTVVYLGLPTGVDVDYSVDPPDFGGCVGATPPERWSCFGSSIPALGGQQTYVIHLTADFAAQPADWTISGFTIRFAAAGASSDDQAADLSPGNNRLAPTLLLTSS